MHYTAEITDNVTDISLNEPMSFEASKKTTLFKFKPTLDVTKKQLDITVSSQSDTVAYLKVSDICKRAMNTGCLDYSGSSLRLTFGKQGRITLSRASRPSLNTSGFTYIGIALKNHSSKNLTKSVKLTVTSSFDYKYFGPLCFLICASLFGGILVSAWACLCFRDPHIPLQDNSVDSDRLNGQNLEMLPSCGSESEAGNTDESRPLIGENKQRMPLNVTCDELFGPMRELLLGHWVARGPKTFSYTTCIVGFALLIGASQFVFESWKGMIESGDRDRCYYNDFCYRVTGYDIPFNLMISNLVYMIHGGILAFFVLMMEARLLVRCRKLARHKRSRSPLPEGQDKLPKHCIECPCIDAHLTNMFVPSPETANEEANILLDAEAYKRKFTFSIGYSLAWALIFEGCFSTVYHFCPKELTFQFDSAFMFVISGLIVTSLYNGTSFKECTVNGEVQLPVHSNNFFLFLIVPLFIFNYFGSLYFSDKIILSSGMTIFFKFCFWAFILILFLWAGYKLFWNRSSCPDIKSVIRAIKSVIRDIKETKKILFFIFILSFIMIVIVLNVWFKENYPNILLFGCISTSTFAICGKLFVQCGRYTKPGCLYKVLQALYVSSTLVIMGIALYFFALKATTDKEKSPPESRDLNHECVLLGFFDDHDLWHILSSFSLLMGAYLVLHISK